MKREDILAGIEKAQALGDSASVIDLRGRLAALAREQAQEDAPSDPIAARNIRDGVAGLIANVKKANPGYDLTDLNKALARCDAELAEAEKNARNRRYDY